MQIALELYNCIRISFTKIRAHFCILSLCNFIEECILSTFCKLWLVLKRIDLGQRDCRKCISDQPYEWSSENTHNNNSRQTAYMPYLTLCDKISKNLAHVEANSHKVFTDLTERLDHLTTQFMTKTHKSRFVVLNFIITFIHLNKGFWLFWGASKWFL